MSVCFHDSSVLIYTDEKNVPSNRVEVNGLQVIPLPEVLCRLGPQFFKNNPREAEIALNLIRDPGELLTILLAGEGMPSAAGRLAGALRFMGRDADADRITETMKRAKHNVRESNPFEISTPMQTTHPEVGKTYVSKTDPTFSIYVRRIDLIEADGDDPAGFIVEGCNPKDKGNEDASCYELIDDEWNDFSFAPVPSQTA